ncbi:MAG: Tc toxin subunit A, partial [Acidobacteriales bacterium]|nr:Tc toxin subunit A [Terriglobales bacterium]
MSSKKQDEIHAVISKNRPDYAALFGSVELCDCQHCRSIYSPAAYLVDLLQFLGPNTPGMITPLDALIGNSKKTWPNGKPVVGRRPDIAHIQLSCENTNTTIPYVDLVNEVLESYIAFDQTLPVRETDEAGAALVPPVPQPNESSPGVTAAELAANPENTRDLAYEELEAAVYPFTLPFNQPVTSLRLTLEQMGSSRHEVMAVFGKKDDDAAGYARDVEALKLTEGEFAVLTGKQFDGITAATWPPPAWNVSAFYGFETPVAPVDVAWVAGSLPPSAVKQGNIDTWTFAAFAPAPPSGAVAHASTVAAGLHQHFFDKVSDAGKLKVGNEDFLYAEIFLDPANLPQMVMLQFFDGTRSHRAYWGGKQVLYLGDRGHGESPIHGANTIRGRMGAAGGASLFRGHGGRNVIGYGLHIVRWWRDLGRGREAVSFMGGATDACADLAGANRHQLCRADRFAAHALCQPRLAPRCGAGGLRAHPAELRRFSRAGRE